MDGVLDRPRRSKTGRIMASLVKVMMEAFYTGFGLDGQYKQTVNHAKIGKQANKSIKALDTLFRSP